MNLYKELGGFCFDLNKRLDVLILTMKEKKIKIICNPLVLEIIALHKTIDDCMKKDQNNEDNNYINTPEKNAYQSSKKIIKSRCHTEYILKCN